MTKNDLINRVAESSRRTKKEAEEAIDSVFASIAEALANGDKVDLRGFGNFQVSHKGARKGRNPRTGEEMTIAARSVAIFKPGKELAERVNRSVAGGGDTQATTNGDMPLAEPGQGSAKVHGDKIA